MKLFAKYFICVTSLLCIAILFSGYMLITSSQEQSIEQEIKAAVNQYQHNKSVVSNKFSFYVGRLQNDVLFNLFPLEFDCPFAFVDGNKTLLFSSLSFQPDLSFLDDVADDTAAYSLQKTNSTSYVLVAGKLTLNKETMYFLNAIDIRAVTEQKDLMFQNFRWIYFVTLGIGMIFTFLISMLLTRPIKQLTMAANRISHGDYTEQLSVLGNDEIADLSDSFNLMSVAIQEQMKELEKSARQKEDFVAAFAHELKTPLTSVIGYADMLYQKTLPPQEVKNAAWYVLSEGLRLEALALKLMDLIVLHRQEFILEEMRSDKVLQNACDGLVPLLAKKNVKLHFESDTAYIRVDFDLFKTLLLNLIDNAIKAECSNVRIVGTRQSNCFILRVTDDGRGIPKAELSRITEAFYMVDKSRSRGQHGAGLGLALALKIADIHHGTIKFDSHEGLGTSITIAMPCEGSESNG